MEIDVAGLWNVLETDGLQTRDFIYVDDVIEALAFVGANARLTGESNTEYISILGLARQVVQLAGARSPINDLPVRLGDLRHSCAVISELGAVGFSPEGSVEDGINEIIEVYPKKNSGRSWFVSALSS